MEEQSSKAKMMAKYLSRFTNVGERIKRIRPPRTTNKDQENARRRRQMDSGFLNRESRGTVEVK